MDRVYGIDLGTTYSCIYYINEMGKTVVIPNSEGDRTTPSVVWFNEGTIVVGQESKSEAAYDCDNVCRFVKRSMGQDDFQFQYDGVDYLPEEISSFILRKLVQDASEQIGEVIKNVVITCPAYFFVKERDATKRAGELAGLNVLQIVNEPTAAAVAYNWEYRTSMSDDAPSKIMVFDLGGGTFDVTTMLSSKSSIDVLCTDGDHHLGGKDWDERIVLHIIECISNQTGEDSDELMEDAQLMYELTELSEKIKKRLSEKNKDNSVYIYNGRRIPIELTREEFEEITSDLLDRTINFAQDVLRETISKDPDWKLERIILVGGSCKMPIIKKKIGNILAKESRVSNVL